MKLPRSLCPRHRKAKIIRDNTWFRDRIWIWSLTLRCLRLTSDYSFESFINAADLDCIMSWLLDCSPVRGSLLNKSVGLWISIRVPYDLGIISNLLLLHALTVSTSNRREIGSRLTQLSVSLLIWVYKGNIRGSFRSLICDSSDWCIKLRYW